MMLALGMTVRKAVDAITLQLAAMIIMLVLMIGVKKTLDVSIPM
jgi:hypothetical protein